MNSIQRRGIIVWVYSIKNLNQLKKFGVIHYTSRRMNYVTMYVDEHALNDITEKIKRLHFVRSVEISYLPDIDMTFADALEINEDKQEEQVN